MRTGLKFICVAAIAVPGMARAQETVDPAAAAAKDEPASSADEIVITATKRPEVARKISGSVTAVSGERLQQLGASDFADYLTRTPGVVFNAATPGSSNITIRGVSTTTGQDQGQPTTGIFINDVPLTDPTLSIGTPDIDTFDVDNVTVLRGPQGTLFGSGSLGGAVNYQASHPDLSAMSAHVQGTLETVAHGGTGGSAKAMVNIPIVTDQLAVRGVFAFRRDAGFIDNVGTGQSNSNRVTTKSGRLLATWKAGPDTTLNYLFLRQQQDNRDVGYEEPDLAGKYKKTTFAPEYADLGTLIHNLRLDQDLGFGTLTATGTYHRKTLKSLSDLTPALSEALFGLAPVPSLNPGKSKGETFEVRLASAPGTRFEYLIGAFYDHTKMKQSQVITAPGLEDLLDFLFGPGAGASIAPGNLVVDAKLPADAREAALFGEGTYHFNEQWKVTVGGRLFDQKLENGSIATGLIPFLNAGEASVEQVGTQKSHGFNPKASLTWTPNERVLGYVLASKGFRFGGANLVPPLPDSPVPFQFKSDSLWNYEAGIRTNLLENRLLLDVTAFHINWSDIQLRLRFNGINYADNAGKAKIDGVETSARFRLFRDLDLNTSLTWLDARLTEPFDSDLGDPTNSVVPSGTRLPGASKWQFSNALTYQGRSTYSPFLLLSHRYISSAPSQLQDTIRQGGYHLFDARAGFKTGRVGITAFIANITDVRGVTASTNDPLQQFLVQPRTVGVTLDSWL